MLKKDLKNVEEKKFGGGLGGGEQGVRPGRLSDADRPV